MTVLHSGTAEHDRGNAISQVLATSDVVVFEVAERSLVRGSMSVLNSPALDNILKKLSG
jgi:hypothetical protein